MSNEIKPETVIRGNSKIAVRVHDARLVNFMALHLHNASEVTRPTNGLGGNRPPSSSEMSSLVKAANLVKAAEKMGYSQEAAYGLIGQGVGRMIEIGKIVNGKTATDKPATPEGKSRAGCSTYNNSARNANIHHKRDYNSNFKGEWDATPGTEDAKGKDDAADTGEWFG
jgi:hypothetical protein